MLENKVLDITSDNVEKLGDEGLAFVFGDVGLPAETLPEFLSACNCISIRLGCFALAGDGFLFGVRFFRGLG